MVVLDVDCDLHQQAPNGQSGRTRDVMRSDLIDGLIVQDNIGVADADGSVWEEKAEERADGAGSGRRM